MEWDSGMPPGSGKASFAANRASTIISSMILTVSEKALKIIFSSIKFYKNNS